MINIVKELDPTQDFFETNPQFKILTPFNELLKEKDGSACMWYAALYSFPDEDENIFIRIDPATREKVLREGLNLKDKNLDKYVYAFQQLCLTPVQKALLEEIEQLYKRSKLIKDTELSLDSVAIVEGKSVTIKGTALQINTLQKDALKVYEQYEVLKEKFISQKKAAKVKGKIVSPGESQDFWG